MRGTRHKATHTHKANIKWSVCGSGEPEVLSSSPTTKNFEISDYLHAALNTDQLVLQQLQVKRSTVGEKHEPNTGSHYK